MSIIDSVKSVFVPINREGHPFIAIIAVATLVMFGLSDVLGSIGLILTVWCIYFFRDPVRSVPSREGLVISPADGVVQKIDSVAPPAELEMGSEALTRVCVFMNVFDVHVNRSPIAGTVSAMHYYPGTFVSAAEKESDQNERQALRISTADGKHFAVVQIAGLIARRIVCNAKAGDALAAGERFGMIRFGSRVDVYLPAGVSPLVVVGQRMVSGETIIADLKSDETARTGTRI